MKIGILTFHWATNYGAVLQTYATQTMLELLGHEVVVIDYKPTIYDNSIKSLLRAVKNNKIGEYLINLKKEKSLCCFRAKQLKLTSRVSTYKEITSVANELDCIITGSDQVLNPTFFRTGEGNGVLCPAYFLGFEYQGGRVAYAVSFGTVSYPEELSSKAIPFVSKFNKFGTREASGVEIVKLMGRSDAVVVPDPTILLASNEYIRLANSSSFKSFADIYCFFIRHIPERKVALNTLHLKGSMLWNNADGDYSLEGWLAKIKNAKFVITDSFHCMVMCLKMHTPFVVVTELKGNTGMNDRLYTLLSLLALEERIVYKDEVSSVPSILEKVINWDITDQQLNDYKSIGIDFLKSI